MKKYYALFLFLLIVQLTNAQELLTRYEKSKHTETATYIEGITYYEQLANMYEEVQMAPQGLTDSGHPLHLVLLSNDKDFNISSLRQKGKTILLINNGIHAGEPDGVEASMMLLRDLLNNKEKYEAILEEVVIAVIPFYNIGGILNRNSTSRVNQNGPKEYGFRGNARNFDLNRDFIKCDTRNARSFAALFHYLDPDIFVDTHVSNGADYQYVMTMDYAQKDKLGGVLSDYLEEEMMPYLYQKMEAGGYEMITYVNAWGNTPDKGFPQFMDWPRYSSGYTALFHTIGFMSETHMLKPFKQRVEATYLYLMSVLDLLAIEGDKVQQLRQVTKEKISNQIEFPIDWKLDKTTYSDLRFKGYKGEYPISEVTGQKRLKYNQDKPFDDTIKYYNQYIPSVLIEKPTAYIIPKGWHNIIDLLKLNQVKMDVLAANETLAVETYYIDNYETSKRPYEGHYMHSQVTVKKVQETVNFSKGDVKIFVNQWTNRYIVEMLEPQGHDSFFAWNFFDTILQQKEGFSSYVFEDLAFEILAKNTTLKQAFEAKKAADESFAKSAYQQLNYIYKHSEHYEEAHLRYPIFRWKG